MRAAAAARDLGPALRGREAPCLLWVAAPRALRADTAERDEWFQALLTTVDHRKKETEELVRALS